MEKTMAKAFAALSVALLLLAPGFGAMPVSAAEDAAETDMIVGGSVAPEGRYPWQVRLFTSLEDERGRCGGTLVADRWVLTSAHCVLAEPGTTAKAAPLEAIVVGYGSTDRTKLSKVESQEIVLHPAFRDQGEKSHADLALIRLAQPVAGIEPVQLADPGRDKKLVTPGAKVTVIGWGALWDPSDHGIMEMLAQLTAGADLDERLNHPLKLHQVEIQVLDNDSCARVLETSNVEVTNSEICAMAPSSRKNSCYGDSGGPLLVDTGDKEFVQIGVVSRGCGAKDLPNVYTRVSAFADWIRTTVGARTNSETSP
jgi:secreted trypsin-like serine protease